VLLKRAAPFGPTAGLALAVALLAAVGAARAQDDDGRSRREKAKLVELVAERSAAAPGTTLRLAAVAEVEPGWHVQAAVPTYDYLIPTALEIVAPAGWPAATVAYPAPHLYRFAFAEEELAVYEGRLILIAEQPVPAAAAGGAVFVARLRYQACDDKSCLPPVTVEARLELPVAPGGAPQRAELFAAGPRAEAGTRAPAGAAASAAAPAGASRLGMLVLALAGGLILNAMPCVLPILSLKVVGLVKAAGQARGEVRRGALATTAGILISFWALAGAAIAAKSAGAAVGWGIQFQQPGFVAFLAVVVLFFTLNLWGLFEIVLPYRLATAAERGGAGEGLGGHFASGLFATLMATPCSAPFLGTALSFALAQSAPTILAIFTAVGVGLALPYLLLAAAPGAARLLPRPGAWMETLRGALGFLLAGAVIWLLYVLAAQIASEGLAVVEVALLAIALALWLGHRAATGSAGRRIGWAAALLLAFAAIVLADRAPRAAARLAAGDATAAIAWLPFDRAEAERLSAEEGRLVFLDVTAEWCVTCKVNERLVLSTPELAAAFERYDVVPMKADWTNRDDAIARFLAEHGRYGIPFYLLYRPGREPHVFGELITRQGVIDVLAASAAP
jgi:suppressor for copper-sensitivity B